VGEALAIGAQLPEPDEEGGDHPLVAMARSTLIPVLVNRGAVAEAEELYAPLREKRSSGELQERYVEAYFRALLLRARGRMTEALEAGETAMALKEALSGRILRYGTVEALEAAFELGDVGRVEKLIALIEAETPQASSTHLRAQAARFRAKLAAAQDEGDVAARGFERAAATFREIKAPFWLAVVLLEHGEWLVRAGRAGEADTALDEAAEIFASLKAAPWEERVAVLRRADAAVS